jgi:hypothetical protein
MKNWGEPRYERHEARFQAARRRHSHALRRGAPTTKMAPCRRNPMGTGGLRHHLASETPPRCYGIAVVALPCLVLARPLCAAAPQFFIRPPGPAGSAE